MASPRGSSSIPEAGQEYEFLDFGGYHTHHHSCFSRAFVKITLSIVVLVHICLVLNQSAYPTQLRLQGCSYTFLTPKDSSTSETKENLSSPFHQSKSIPSYFDNKSNDEKQLESILKKASMVGNYNNTVILTTLNAAWTEPNSIFDLFMESFRVGYKTENLLKHLVVVALDQKAYTRCMEVHIHCVGLTTENVDFSGEAQFMTEDYLKLVWRKIEFMRTVLELGYNFVFTDSDIMWLRDPFERFYPDGDIQIACDKYIFNSTDLNNPPNAGFKYVKASNRTIKLYKFWYEGKHYFPRNKTQDVLNVIKFNPFFQQIGLKMRFLDTAYFGGFCEPSKDLDLVITMHANCCLGMKNKTHDIKMVIDDWKKYKAVPAGERNLSTRSWTVPRLCGEHLHSVV